MTAPRWVFPICVVIATSACCAHAQESVSIGKLRVRADSPLVKGEYPRLAITRAQLPAIRARLKHPEIQMYLKQADDLITLKADHAFLLGTLYQVTGEKRYAELAKRKLGNVYAGPTWTLAFDLIAETMTTAERKEVARKMLAYIKANRWKTRSLLALSAWGNGIDGELTPYLEAAHAHEVVRMLKNNNRWSRGRGGSSMGHGYNGEHYFSVEYATAMAWSNATGVDLLATCDFAANTPAWYVYHTLPWEKSREIIRIGVTRATRHMYTLTPASSHGESTVMRAITGTRNGLGQWWQREFVGDYPQPHWSKGREHHLGLAGRILWLDPTIPSVPPEKFPETRLFPENGHVIMRSDWTEDATVALFRCGRFGEIDGHWGRNNADNLHFIIYKNGYLAPDTGCVHNGNEGIWKMTPNANLYQYARGSIAHNTITVGGKPISYTDWHKNVIGIARRGGQTLIQKREYFRQWGLDYETARHGFKEGAITAYSTSPAFDYASGDATHSYPPERVKKITRQFVYLKPDVFVIFDRVTPADEKLKVIWNLHAYQKPTWDGKTEPDARKEGHFLHTGGDTFTTTNRGGAFLDTHLLLPVEADRTVRTLGGKGHDFEVDGVNYGPTDETYRLLEKRKGNGEPEGVGGWRIEVSPKTVNGEVHFLHVLRVGTPVAGAKMPLTTTLVKDAQRAGVKIRFGTKEAEVTFNIVGETGGRLVLGDRAEDLVTKLEDNYDRWKADPRYAEWQTNEFMRTVIFPYGKKP